MTTTLDSRTFDIETTDHALDRNLPQRVGGKLWKPLLVMALMGFAVGVVLAVIRANAIANGDALSTITSLGHFVPAAMFVGFASVFAAISFAIARILGELRTGGGAVQEAVGAPVETLNMPPTAKAFIGLMAMAMMIIVAGVVGHIIIGAQIASGDAAALADSEQWAIWLEGVRRFGTALLPVRHRIGTRNHHPCAPVPGNPHPRTRRRNQPLTNLPKPVRPPHLRGAYCVAHLPPHRGTVASCLCRCGNENAAGR